MRIAIPIVCLALIALAACNGDDAGPAGGEPGFASADPTADAKQSDRPILLYRDDFGRLVADSPSILLATLVGRSFERDERGLIVTRNELEIERAIRGQVDSSEVTLTTLGGTLDDETLTVSHMPVFRDGWRYVVFTDLERTTYDPVTGNQDGVFIVGADDGIYTYQGVGVAGFEDGRLQLGAAVLSPDEDRPDRERSRPVDEDPKTEGEIVAVERAAPPTLETLALADFIDLIRRLADYQEDPS